MFFCNKDPQLDAYVPDLEPIKLGISIFSESLQEIAGSEK